MRKRSCAAGLGLLSLLAIAAVGDPALAGGSDDARRLLEMSETDDMEQRARICRELAEGRPAAFALFFCEGYEAILFGRDREAEIALQNALEQRPDFALAPIIYGDLYAHLGKLELAESCYRRAVAVGPDRTDAHFSLGAILYRRGRLEDPKHFEEALSHFETMTRLDPASPDGYCNMGMVQAWMGRVREAEESYRRAIERNPDDPFLFDSLGSLYARLERNDQAEAAWRHAMGLNPGYGPAIIELAALYARTERLARAIQVLEGSRDAAQAPPWGPRIRRNLGFAYLRLGETDVARERFSQAAASGRDALAHLGLAHLRMLDGDSQGALAAFEAGAALDSSLAYPFVQAWKATLKFALDPGLHGSLARVVRRLDRDAAAGGPTPTALNQPEEGPSGRPAPETAVPAASTGVQATPHLVAFVLEGWSFEEAEAVRAEITKTQQSDSLQTQYDSPPVPVQKVPAEYPESAQASGLQGTVAVVVVVDENGHVIDARTRDCNAPMVLCDAAEAAARKWIFKPASRFGAPVRASVVVPFRFTAAER